MSPLDRDLFHHSDRLLLGQVCAGLVLESVRVVSLMALAKSIPAIVHKFVVHLRLCPVEHSIIIDWHNILIGLNVLILRILCF